MLTNLFVKAIRASGQALDVLGRKFELNPNIDKLLPSTRIVKLGNNIPKVKGVFIAPDAAVVGNVSIGTGSSVWYGAVVRGDVNSISIGDNVSIGDRVMVHCSGAPSNKPTNIGNNVVINSGAIIHGATLEDGCFIGEGSQVMDGATVSKNAVLGAGAFLSVGKVIPTGQLWSGVPAKFERNLTTAEIEKIGKRAESDLALSQLHARENAKSFQEIQDELYDYNQTVYRSDEYYKRLTPQEISKRLGEVEGHNVPGRIFDHEINAK